MIVIKPGVVFKKLKPEIYGLFAYFDTLFKHYGVDAVITSANDGRHMKTSKHYEDLAIDLRSKHVDTVGHKLQIVELVRHELGGDYDVLLESMGRPNEHFHVEFDPKDLK